MYDANGAALRAAVRKRWNVHTRPATDVPSGAPGDVRRPLRVSARLGWNFMRRAYKSTY